MLKFSLRWFVPALMLCGFAAHAQAAEMLYSYSSHQHSIPDSMDIDSPARIKCIDTSAEVSGHPTSCYVRAPGFQGVVGVGQTVGASGPGTIELTCHGTSASDASTCAVIVDSTACVAEQNLSAYARNGSQYPDSAATSSPASLTCTSASGASNARCSFSAPGFMGFVGVGQTVGTTGPGTVTLYCAGTYPVGGGLNCAAKVAQSCP